MTIAKIILHKDDQDKYRPPTQTAEELVRRKLVSVNENSRFVVALVEAT